MRNEFTTNSLEPLNLVNAPGMLTFDDTQEYLGGLTSGGISGAAPTNSLNNEALDPNEPFTIDSVNSALDIYNQQKETLRTLSDPYIFMLPDDQIQPYYSQANSINTDVEQYILDQFGDVAGFNPEVETYINQTNAAKNNVKASAFKYLQDNDLALVVNDKAYNFGDLTTNAIVYEGILDAEQIRHMTNTETVGYQTFQSSAMTEGDVMKLAGSLLLTYATGGFGAEGLLAQAGMAGGQTLAQGGDVQDALQAAVTTGLTSAITSGVGEQVGNLYEGLGLTGAASGFAKDLTTNAIVQGITTGEIDPQRLVQTAVSQNLIPNIANLGPEGSKWSNFWLNAENDFFPNWAANTLTNVANQLIADGDVEFMDALSEGFVTTSWKAANDYIMDTLQTANARRMLEANPGLSAHTGQPTVRPRPANRLNPTEAELQAMQEWDAAMAPIINRLKNSSDLMGLFGPGGFFNETMDVGQDYLSTEWLSKGFQAFADGIAAITPGNLSGRELFNNFVSFVVNDGSNNPETERYDNRWWDLDQQVEYGSDLAGIDELSTNQYQAAVRNAMLTGNDLQSVITAGDFGPVSFVDVYQNRSKNYLNNDDIAEMIVTGELTYEDPQEIIDSGILEGVDGQRAEDILRDADILNLTDNEDTNEEPVVVDAGTVGTADDLGTGGSVVDEGTGSSGTGGMLTDGTGNQGNTDGGTPVTDNTNTGNQGATTNTGNQETTTNTGGMLTEPLSQDEIESRVNSIIDSGDNVAQKMIQLINEYPEAAQYASQQIAEYDRNNINETPTTTKDTTVNDTPTTTEDTPRGKTGAGTGQEPDQQRVVDALERAIESAPNDRIRDAFIGQWESTTGQTWGEPDTTTTPTTAEGDATTAEGDATTAEGDTTTAEGDTTTDQTAEDLETITQSFTEDRTKLNQILQDIKEAETQEDRDEFIEDYEELTGTVFDENLPPLNDGQDDQPVGTDDDGRTEGQYTNESEQLSFLERLERAINRTPNEAYRDKLITRWEQETGVPWDGGPGSPLDDTVNLKDDQDKIIDDLTGDDPLETTDDEDVPEEITTDITPEITEDTEEVTPEPIPGDGEEPESGSTDLTPGGDGGGGGTPGGNGGTTDLIPGGDEGGPDPIPGGDDEDPEKPEEPEQPVEPTEPGEPNDPEEPLVPVIPVDPYTPPPVIPDPVEPYIPPPVIPETVEPYIPPPPGIPDPLDPTPIPPDIVPDPVGIPGPTPTPPPRPTGGLLTGSPDEEDPFDLMAQIEAVYPLLNRLNIPVEDFVAALLNNSKRNQR